MSKTILLVEDEALIAMSQARMLKKHEYEVISAYSGEKAIEAVDSDPKISLILMDIDLGKGMDGTEAAQKILKEQDLPIVFLTSHSEKEYVDRVKKITNYGYVLKNSGEFVLVESINMAFHLYEAHKELQNQKKNLQTAIFQQEKSKNAYQRIFNLTPGLFCVAGIDGYFKELNPEWEKTLGYTIEELKSRPWIDFIHPDDIEPTQHEIEKQTSGGETADFINRYYHKNGSYRYLEWNAMSSEQGRLYASAKDITEQIHKDKELKKSEEKYRLLFNYSNDAIFVHEIGEDKLPGRIIEVNEQACRLLQYSREELLQMSIKDITAEEDQSLILSRAKELFEKKHLTFVSEDVRRDGTLTPVEVSAHSYSEGGKVFVVSSIRDITERKQAEETLKESESLFRGMFEEHSAVMLLINPNTGQIINANQSAIQYYGYPLEIMHQRKIQLFNMLSPEEIEEQMLNALNKQSNIFEFRHMLADGQVRDVEVNSTPITVQNQKLLFSIIQDITERKQAEQALKESEKKLSLIVNESPFPMAIADLSNEKIQYWSQNAVKMFGHSPTTVSEWYELAYPDPEYRKKTIERWKSFLEDARESATAINAGEYPITCKDGSIKICEIFAQYIPHSIVVTFNEITERKQVEVELRRKKELLNYTQQLAHMGGWEWNIETQTMTWTDETYNIHGMTPGELAPGTPGYINLSLGCYDPADRMVIEAAFKSCAEDGQSYDMEFPLTRFDGRRIWIRTMAYAEKQGDRIVRVFGNIMDITERKQAENALREKTEMLNNIIENISDLVVLADVSGYITFHSNLYETLGYGQDSLITRNVLEFVHPEDLPEIESYLKKLINNKEDKRRVEYRFRCADDSYIWLETDGKTIKDTEGSIKKVLFSAREITDRKKAQDVIKESEEKYRLITENASDIIIQVDDQLKPTYISPSVTEYFGYKYEDVSEQSMLEFVVPADRERIEKMIDEKANKEEKQFTQTHRVFTKSGEIRWLETNVNHLYDEEGQITGELYVARDITNLRKLQNLSKERSIYLEAILESTPNGIIIFDSQNNINEWNRGAENLFHYTREEVLGHNIDEIVGGEDDIVYEEALSFSQQTLSGESVPPVETVRFTKERRPLSVIVAGSPILVDGTFTGVVASYTDVSHLKQKEKEVETLLEEKEHLLHEVHHRIKNHMNTISSIISLRASHIDNPQIKDVLEEVQDKVNLMQNIYQSLYTGQDVGSICISSYLEPVLHDIRYGYIDSQYISISTDIEEVEVTSKQSFPIGIIITELITNSIKYAFDKSGEGKIHISIHTDKENIKFLCIEVADNGKGMPPEIVENGEYGFGLTLVEGYTKQFDGTMSISTDGGTTVHVVLELE